MRISYFKSSQNNIEVYLLEQYIFLAIRTIVQKYEMPLDLREDYTTFDISAKNVEILMYYLKQIVQKYASNHIFELLNLKGDLEIFYNDEQLTITDVTFRDFLSN